MVHPVGRRPANVQPVGPVCSSSQPAVTREDKEAAPVKPQQIHIIDTDMVKHGAALSRPDHCASVVCSPAPA